MKKILLASIAFISIAPMAHAEIDLSLAGYARFYAGYADQQNDDVREFDFKRKTKIYFTGKTTLDNGLTVGYMSELLQEEANVPASYIFFSGDWGYTRIGRERGAPHNLQVDAPSADSNIDGRDIHINFINLNGIGVDRDYRHSEQDGYADKITFLTPKANGFQAGVSYSPEAKRYTIADAEDGMDADNEAGDFADLVAGAIRYDGEFSGVGVSVGGGYSQMALEANGGAAAFTDDYKEWNVGLKLSYKGFRVGGAYNEDNSGGSAATGDTENWATGVDYTVGQYKFGTSYFNSSNAVDDEFERITAGVNYTYGPGFSLRGSAGLFDVTDGGADSNDGVFAVVGTDITF